jgi:hypothetical protein
VSVLTLPPADQLSETTSSVSMAGGSGLFRNLDAWRAHPLLKARIQDYVPGMGTAIVAFSAYVVAETAWKSTQPKTDSHH